MSLVVTVNEAVRASVAEADPNLMVTRSVVLMEYFDAEGKRKICIAPSEDARWWDVQGLCHYALSYADAIIAQDATS